jgi:hypothetical protein
MEPSVTQGHQLLATGHFLLPFSVRRINRMSVCLSQRAYRQGCKMLAASGEQSPESGQPVRCWTLQLVRCSRIVKSDLTYVE